MITEAKWLSSTEPGYLLDHARNGLRLARSPRGRRKFLLFAAACAARCRERDLYDAAAWSVSERYADGLATNADFLRQLPAMKRVVLGAHQCARTDAWYVAAQTSAEIRRINSGGWQNKQKLRAESAAQADLVREVFGNPFRALPDQRAWLSWHDGTIPRLAQCIYDERAFDRLPILADALEDAGCANAEILAHCRGNGTHVRGCWVVDLLLRKA
jgi:hypothetical protein